MKPIQINWHGRLPVVLLETKLSSNAKICYGVMNSFGPESRASLDAIGRRMSISRNTVRKAQRELQKAGWIELISEGGKRAEGFIPRKWMIYREPTNKIVGNYPFSPSKPANLKIVS